MARAKFDPVTSGIIGKVGGQNLSYTNNGFIIRPTIYTKSPYSPKRSIQRNITRTISAKWATLTAGEKLAWQTAAVDYSYTNSIGNTITRNNFETFSFCNQNRNTVGLGILTTAPAFYPITPPTVTRETTAQSQFVIKASVADINLEYSVFVTVNWSQGYQAYNQKPLLTKVLTYAEILAGYDIMPDVKNTFPTPDFITSISVKIFAIHPPSGNKDLNGVYLNGLATYTGLGLDILSYYPFNSNANDYFSNNNPTYVGTTFDSSGLVNGAAIFGGGTAQYINLGNNASLNFSVGGVVQPFTVCLWLYATTATLDFIFGKRTANVSGFPASYQMVKRVSDLRAQSWDVTDSKNYSTISSSAVPLNQWVFLTFTYNSDGSVEVYMDSVLSTNNVITGAYTAMTPQSVNMIVGRYIGGTGFELVGRICELTFFNQKVDFTTQEIIKTANLAGQSILDIN